MKAENLKSLESTECTVNDGEMAVLSIIDRKRNKDLCSILGIQCVTDVVMQIDNNNNEIEMV